MFYGVTTLLVAVEGVYLPDALPPDLVSRLLVNGFITAALFSPLAVLLHRRHRTRQAQMVPSVST